MQKLIVLIDTWWNVNKISPSLTHKKHLSFNRYMVECECYMRQKQSIDGNSFNRYMVECESYLNNIYKKRLISFNRYMVECEYGSDEKNCAERWCFNRYMVECEFEWVIASGADITVLIDTWWNVNYSFLNSMSNMLDEF